MHALTLLSGIKGIGKVTTDKLEAIGLTTVADFAEYFPRKYSDYSVVSDIAHLQPGLVAIQAHLTDVKQRRVRRGLHITEAAAEDASGRVKVVWFNQPYRAAGIKSGQVYYLQGEFGLQSQRLQLLNPSTEAVSDMPLSGGDRIVATYRESGELTSVVFRKIASQLQDFFEQLPETLPEWLVNKYGLLPRGVAVRAIHLPKSDEELASAK
jgi:ATP-dependent DNA helicase RecG